MISSIRESFLTDRIVLKLSESTFNKLIFDGDVDINDTDSVALFLSNNWGRSYIDTLERLGLLNNKNKFKEVFDKMKKINIEELEKVKKKVPRNRELQYKQKIKIIEYENKIEQVNELERIVGFKFKNIKDKDELIRIIKEEANKINYDAAHYHNNYNNHTDRYIYMDFIYSNLVPKKMQHNLDFITSLLEGFLGSFPFVYKYIDKKDINTILDKYYIDVYKKFKKFINEEEFEYVIKLVKKSDSFISRRRELYDSDIEWSLARCNSRLLYKLKAKYWDYFLEKAEKSGIEPDDNSFLKSILKSNILKKIYLSGYYDNNDVDAINTLLNTFEHEMDCSKIRKNIADYKREISQREVGICNYLVINKDNPEKIDELLAELKVTKDNYFTYIKERKFLDSKLKESALLILGKHFKTNTISVYDIIEMLQEMEDRELTLDEILIDRNINKKIFYNIYDRFKEENPEMFQFIQEALSKNQIRGFKKLLKLYYSIINSGINKYDDFVEKYEKTPEEILEMFSSIDDLYDNLNKYISSWYSISSKKEEKKR